MTVSIRYPCFGQIPNRNKVFRSLCMVRTSENLGLDRRRGISLVEVLLALALIAIVVPSLVEMVLQYGNLTSRADDPEIGHVAAVRLFHDIDRAVEPVRLHRLANEEPESGFSEQPASEQSAFEQPASEQPVTQRGEAGVFELIGTPTEFVIRIDSEDDQTLCLAVSNVQQGDLGGGTGFGSSGVSIRRRKHYVADTVSASLEAEDVMEEVMFGGISVQFAYFDGLVWSDDFSEGSGLGLPVAIRISCFAPGKRGANGRYFGNYIVRCRSGYDHTQLSTSR